MFGLKAAVIVRVSRVVVGSAQDVRGAFLLFRRDVDIVSKSDAVIVFVVERIHHVIGHHDGQIVFPRKLFQQVRNPV